MTEQDDLRHGFDAGNYANAYVSADLERAWTVEYQKRERRDEEPSSAYRAAFVIGFFGTYEDDEIDFEHREEHDEAIADYGQKMRDQGIAVNLPGDG